MQDMEKPHTVAMAGIRVGRENLKLVKSEAGVWPTILEHNKKGGIDQDDLKVADQNVQCVTGWSDPVD